MNNENLKQPAQDSETGKPETEPTAAAGLTQQDEEVLLKRLRELGYVE
jgi:hypothetical protein